MLKGDDKIGKLQEEISLGRARYNREEWQNGSWSGGM
jgi:hypothetical protein